MTQANYIWLDGNFVKFEDAKVHVLTHSLQYGSGVFEGIRCYNTSKGPAIFRLHDHARRFFDSAKIYKLPLKITQKQFEEAIVELINKNKLSSAYIRPFGFYKDIGIGFNVKGKSSSVAIAAIEFGALFDDHGKGIRCKVSSWERINSTIIPAGAKISGNYINSILASLEANDAGYDEAILMSGTGTVAEGPGENLFIVNDNTLITPPKSANILLGITRDSVIKIAQRAGIDVKERDIRREELYTSDEIFFSGTAAEITPIVSVDSRDIGNGKIGPVTSMLKDKYARVARGEEKEFSSWLTFTKG
ncbi:MAG: branched-chain amino acid transaminase [Candidatus Micrarchaeota archaeon]|nr:branched-chain amino acid transaminase [Candidatus Micrarchaeota archaeon]